MKDELEEVLGAAGAVEVLAPVSGLPVEFLYEDLRLGVASSAREDVVEEASVHLSEVARFYLVVEHS